MMNQIVDTNRCVVVVVAAFLVIIALGATTFNKITNRVLSFRKSIA